jgi:hypothetical protein
MPGYNQQQLLYKVQNANAVSVMLGDQLIGFAQTVAPAMDFGAEGLYGIGSAKPQEIQQLKFTNTITLDRFRLTAEGIAYFGETAELSYILAYNAFNFYLLDTDGTAFLSYVGCVASSNSTSIATNQPITDGTSFLALDVLDSDGNSVLNSNSADVFNTLASSTNAALVTPGG